MLVVDRTAEFRRDYKRCKKRGKDVAKLAKLIALLAAQVPLPTSCRDHALQGKWVGCRELHVEGNWLLIYEIEPGKIRLERTGTHADLFN